MSGDPEIRLLRTDDDREAFDQIDFYAFQVAEESRDRARRHNREGETWGAFTGGELAAGYQLLTLRGHLNGAAVEMGGIASVSSAPHHRGKGYVRELMRSSLEVLRERGVPLSVLWPFDYAFYRRLGWELAGEVRRYRLPTEDLGAAAGSLDGVRPGDASDLAAMLGVYERAAVGYNLPLFRDPVWCRDRVLTGDGGVRRTLYVFEAEGRPEGYVLFSLQRTGSHDRRLDVREFVAVTPRARRALFGLVHAHRSQAAETQLLLPMCDPLATEIPNPRVNAVVWPQAMVRVVDWPAAMRARPLWTAGDPAASVGPRDGRLTVRVVDALAPWNHGVWRLEVGDGAVRCERLTGGSSLGDLAVDLGADIRTWSQLYAGFWGDLPASGAGRYGHVRVHRSSALPLADALFAGQETWLPDFF